MKSSKIVCSDNISSFEELLKKDPSFNVHHINIQSLATQLLLSNKTKLSNKIMRDVFENKNLCYNLRSETHFMRTSGNT